MIALIEYATERAKRLARTWLIATGAFLVSSCAEVDGTTLSFSADSSGPETSANLTAGHGFESADAANTASRLRTQNGQRARHLLDTCQSVPIYDPPPIAIIRFNGREGDFVRPLKAAVDRITTLMDEVGFELRVMVPSSFLKDRDDIDIATPRQNIDKIRNSLISLGISELDMISTARESRGNSAYEVHVFALEVCPSVIDGSESFLEI